MLLAIDVGNTNMVFGLYEGDKLCGSFRISTNAERTSDELGMQISQYYHFHGIDRAETRAVIIASVVPPVMYTLINAIRKYLNVQPVVAGRDVDIGIENCYANPREVGTDRLVNAVSAVRQYGKPLIIVDIGTATTFDAIDENGAPVLFAYTCDMPRIQRFDTALELQGRVGTLICFDFQEPVLRRICGPRVTIQSIDFEIFERSVLHPEEEST